MGVKKNVKKLKRITAIDAFFLFGKIVTHIYVIPKNDIL